MAAIKGTARGGGIDGNRDCGLGNRRSLNGGDVLEDRGALVVMVMEEAEHGWHLVEGAVLAEERSVREQAALGLADKGGANKACQVLGRRILPMRSSTNSGGRGGAISLGFWNLDRGG